MGCVSSSSAAADAAADTSAAKRARRNGPASKQQGGAAAAAEAVATAAAQPSQPLFASEQWPLLKIVTTDPVTGTSSTPQPDPQADTQRTAASETADDGLLAADDVDWDWDMTGFGGDSQDSLGKALPKRATSLVEKAAQSAIAGPRLAEVPRESTALRIDKVQGCMFVNQYLVTKFLGRGACGKVFLCLNTHDLKLYAMKAVRKADLGLPPSSPPGAPKQPNDPLDDILREISIMKKMKHPNIVSLFEIIDDPIGNKLLLVMEYMDAGPLLTKESLDRKERVPESRARGCVRDMVKALDYLHEHMVVHGDLKPENALLSTGGSIKLSDFGCSKIFASNEYLDRCNGTPAFLAPEMMKPSSRYRGRPTDVYALGVCLYTLVFGRIPFTAPSVYKLFQLVQAQPVTFPQELPVSDSLVHLLQSMLAKDPQQRITLEAMSRHPWITLDGRFPLKCFRELKDGETNELHDLLPEPGVTFSSAAVEPDLVDLIAQLGSLDHTYNKGDIIMKQGDKGMFLLYITEGTVDILVRRSKPTVKSAPSSSASEGSKGSGSKGSKGPGSEGPTEGTNLSVGLSSVLSAAYCTKLKRACDKAVEFVAALQTAAGETAPGHDLLVAQRGPGSLVGEMALLTKGGQRSATVRCASAITARVILKDTVEKFLEQNLLAKVQMRESIQKRQAENNVVDALVKLANTSEEIPGTGPTEAAGPAT